MADPVSGGGRDAVRFALSTVPALLAAPAAFAMAAGVLAGSVGAGVSTGFSVAIVFAMTMEYLRRGSLAARSPGVRRGLLLAMTVSYYVTALLAAVALVLSIAAVRRCAPPACADADHVVSIVSLVFALIATMACAGLLVFLRSPVWARHRGAVLR